MVENKLLFSKFSFVNYFFDIMINIRIMNAHIKIKNTHY